MRTKTRKKVEALASVLGFTFQDDYIRGMRAVVEDTDRLAVTSREFRDLQRTVDALLHYLKVGKVDTAATREVRPYDDIFKIVVSPKKRRGKE